MRGRSPDETSIKSTIIRFRIDAILYDKSDFIRFEGAANVTRPCMLKARAGIIKMKALLRKTGGLFVGIICMDGMTKLGRVRPKV